MVSSFPSPGFIPLAYFDCVVMVCPELVVYLNTAWKNVSPSSPRVFFGVDDDGSNFLSFRFNPLDLDNL